MNIVYLPKPSNRPICIPYHEHFNFNLIYSSRTLLGMLTKMMRGCYGCIRPPQMG